MLAAVRTGRTQLALGVGLVGALVVAGCAPQPEPAAPSDTTTQPVADIPRDATAARATTETTEAVAVTTKPRTMPDEPGREIGLSEDVVGPADWDWTVGWPEDAFLVESSGRQYGRTLDNGCDLSTYVVGFADLPTPPQGATDGELTEWFAQASQPAALSTSAWVSIETAEVPELAEVASVEFMGETGLMDVDGDAYVQSILLRALRASETLATLQLVCPGEADLSLPHTQVLLQERAATAVLTAQATAED